MVGISYAKKKKCCFTDGHVPTEDEVRQACERIEAARVHQFFPFLFFFRVIRRRRHSGAPEIGMYGTSV